MVLLYNTKPVVDPVNDAKTKTNNLKALHWIHCYLFNVIKNWSKKV